MYRPAARCATALFLLAGAAGAAAQDHAITLEGNWRLALGDDAGWATSPPERTRPIAVGAHWEGQGLTDHDGFAWYFVEFGAGPEILGKAEIRLDLGPIDDADETYLNGVLIGATGDIGGDDSSRWQDPRSYRVPAGVLKEKNLLAVRVWDRGGLGGLHGGPVMLRAFDAVPLGTTSFAYGNDALIHLPVGTEPSDLPPSLALIGDVEIRSLAATPTGLTPRFERLGDRHQVRFDVDLDAIDLYGGGEVTGPLLRDGTSIELWNTDNYVYARAQGRRLYQSHPWVFGVRPDGSSFGVVFDTTWRAELDLSEGIRFSADGDPFGAVIFEEDSPRAMMAALREHTGAMPMPPLWALGFQQCKYSYFPESRVREVANEFRARRIPCDVIWMDIDYMDSFRVFTFDDARFPDPAATNGYLHGLGFRSVWMIDPGVKLDPGYGVYDSGTARDVWVRDAEGHVYVGDVWPGPCVFPDYTSPDVRDWWADLYEPFMATGIDGVWNDMNEPAVFDGPGLTMPTDNLHRGGGDLPAGPHLRYHNVYGMLMVKASREGILAANPDRRPFVLTRANFLGGHRYAATWTGDNDANWEHLKLSIPMSITLGLSGQPFNGPDIGGFRTPKTGMDVELWKHWIALGAFYPFSRSHYAGNNLDFGKEPWSFGPEAEAVARTALERRYRLLPYLYTQFRRAHDTGMPVMQPLFFADPDDPRLRDEQQAFLFGSDLLIVPRWAEAPDLPAGDWAERRILAGASEQDGYQVTVLQRPGSIVPIGPVVQNTDGYKIDRLTLLVHLDHSGRASGTHYEDAYDGFGHRDGEFLLTTFRAASEDGIVDIVIERSEGSLSRPDREIVVRVALPEGAEAVGRGRPGEAITLRVR